VFLFQTEAKKWTNPRMRVTKLARPRAKLR